MKSEVKTMPLKNARLLTPGTDVIINTKTGGAGKFFFRNGWLSDEKSTGEGEAGRGAFL